MKVLSRRPPAGRPPENRRARAFTSSLPLSRISRGSSEQTQSREREGHARPPSKPHLARLTAPTKPSVRRPTRFQPAPEPASDRAAERANVGRLKTRTPALVGRLPLSLSPFTSLALPGPATLSLACSLPSQSSCPASPSHVCKDLHRQRPARGQGHAHRSSAAALHCCCCSCLRPAARRSDLRLCALSLGRRRARSPRPQTATPSSD
jgi:hypothetical protein